MARVDIKDLYKQCVEIMVPTFTVVYIPKKSLNEIDEASESLAKAKLTETQYRKDGASLKARFRTGFKGEVAVGILLNRPVANFTTGPSTSYDVPDIGGYTLGVKTVKYGNFPVIPKKNEYGQIMCICDPNIDHKVYVCGVATKDVLNLYQSDMLILDPNLKEKGTKTAFYGFRNLKSIKSVDDIEEFKIK